MEDVTNIIVSQLELQVDVPMFVCNDCSSEIEYVILIIFAYAFVGYLLWEWNRHE